MSQLKTYHGSGEQVGATKSDVWPIVGATPINQKKYASTEVFKLHSVGMSNGSASDVYLLILAGGSDTIANGETTAVLDIINWFVVPPTDSTHTPVFVDFGASGLPLTDGFTVLACSAVGVTITLVDLSTSPLTKVAVAYA